MLLRERAEVVVDHGFDIASFLAIDRGGRRLYISSGASFDLDEAEHTFIHPIRSISP